MTIRSMVINKAYSDNYDRIFRRLPTLETLPDYGELFELSNIPEMDFHASSSDDGFGYYATEKGYSKSHLFGYVNRPEWATHFLWFNKQRKNDEGDN